MALYGGSRSQKPQVEMGGAEAKVELPELAYDHSPGDSMALSKTMSRIKKADAATYGWDCPLLTFTYPGLILTQVQLSGRERQSR